MSSAKFFTFIPNEISITELNERLKRLENLVSELAKLSSEATEDNKQKIQQLGRISESTNEAIRLITKKIEETSNNFQYTTNFCLYVL